ncbi:PREDICTED: glycerol kinase-like, partial [Diuraphis noxia]|uniref:glycerol kinase-like n=1 Tax=Diuraphis noxia TaxID=143948 RepID=UPI0007637591
MSNTHILTCDKKYNAQKSMSTDEETFVGVIDEGVNSTRFLVFSSKTHLPIACHQISIPNINVYEGWLVLDPEDILMKIKTTIAVVCKKLNMMHILSSAIAAIGVTNQRGTTLVWDKYTGAPLYHALIWMDMATTQSIVDRFINKQISNCNTLDEQKKFLQSKCGSTLNPHFSVFKLIWLMENVPQVSKAIQEERCMFGTMDSWLIWVNFFLIILKLLKPNNLVMQIFNYKYLLMRNRFFDIPESLIFPEIRSCSEVYGLMAHGPLIATPISGCIGDHQGAFLGQLCFIAGVAKCTFGTNCFLLYNTGRKPVISSHGLLTTIAYKIGKHSDPIYALEGSVAVSDFTTEWLKDNLWVMDIYKNVNESTNNLANIEGDLNKIHLIPALSELYAPFWKTDANGKLTGQIIDTSTAYLMRETLERICSQTNEVLQSMHTDTGHPIVALNVDGGMSTNDTFLKILTNICRLPV